VAPPGRLWRGRYARRPTGPFAAGGRRLAEGLLGLLTLAALVAASLGYGLFVLRMLEGPGARLSAALAGAGGLALLCWLGGWLVAAGSYSREASWVLLWLGLAGLMVYRRELAGWLPRRAEASPLALAFAALAAAATAARALGAIRSPFMNPCDDWAAYYHLPKLLLESGGLEEPFGMRRLGTLGLAPLLQSFFPWWTTRGTFFADAALGGLLVWGAARAAARLAAPTAKPAAVEAAGLLAVLASLAIPLANSSPALLPMGGTLALLALTVELDRGAGSIRADLARAALWGACAALVAGMRTSNVALPGMIGATGLALALVRRDAPAARRWLLAALAFLVAIAPWSVASWRSSATPFFPLIRGNYQFASGLSAPLSPGETAAFVASCLWANRLWYPLLLALWVGRDRRLAGTAIIAAVSIVATVAATALALTGSDSFNVYRYSAPLVIGAVAFLAALALGGLELPRSGRARAGLAAVGIASVLWAAVPVQVETHSANDAGQGPRRFGSSPARGIGRNLSGWSFAVRAVLAEGPVEPGVSGGASFAEAQELIEPGARVLSAVSKPFFWRFDRHVIHSVDCPGQASPPPGMPFFSGPDALADYLLGLGYTHLAFSPPRSDPCLYSLSNWTSAATSGAYLWEAWAPWFLDFLRNEQALAAKLGTVYQSRDVVIIDLRRARAD
jgi:hypothetical protein